MDADRHWFIFIISAGANLVKTLFLQVPEHEQTNGDGEQGAACRGETHREQRVRKQDRSEIHARNTHQRNGNNVVQKRKFRSATGAKIPAKAEMNARENTVPDVAAQILTAEHDNGGICCKQTDDRRRDKLDGQSSDNAKADGDTDAAPQYLYRTLRLSGTDILCAKCRNCGKHRGRYQEQKTNDFFHNTNCGGIAESAAIGNHGNDKKGNLNQAVLQGDRNADF